MQGRSGLGVFVMAAGSAMADRLLCLGLLDLSMAYIQPLVVGLVSASVVSSGNASLYLIAPPGWTGGYWGVGVICMTYN